MIGRGIYYKDALLYYMNRTVIDIKVDMPINCNNMPGNKIFFIFFFWGGGVRP